MFIFIYLFIYLFVYLFIYTYVRTYIHTIPHHTIPHHYITLHYITLHYIHTLHLCVYTYTHTHVYVCMYICGKKWMFILVYIMDKWPTDMNLHEPCRHFQWHWGDRPKVRGAEKSRWCASTQLSFGDHRKDDLLFRSQEVRWEHHFLFATLK